MKTYKVRLEAVLALLCIVAITGCTTTTQVGISPQSHFSYPNSNVTPLGHVSGKSSSAGLFAAPGISAEKKEEAINNALAQQPGSDILINYTEVYKTTALFIIQVLAYLVDGTAAKMEIGKQELK